MSSNSRPPTLIILNDQGGAFMSISKDVTATLRAEMGGHPPVVCFDPKWLSPSDTATAIMGENAKDNPVVCYETYHMTGGHCPTLKSRDYKDPPFVCYTQSSFGNYSEGVGTLKANGGDLGGAKP